MYGYIKMYFINAIQIAIRTIWVMLSCRLHHVVIKPGLYNISLGTRIYGKNGGVVSLGKKVSVSRNAVFVANGGSLLIGDRCSFSANCALVSHNMISINENCIFGPGVKIYDHDHSFDEFGAKQSIYKSSSITIDRNCWIGANVIILRDTHIGEGCIVGAGTVLKGNIPPHSIVTNDRSLIIKKITNEYNTR